MGVILLCGRSFSITRNVSLNSKFTAVNCCLIKQFRVLSDSTSLKCRECLNLKHFIASVSCADEDGNKKKKTTNDSRHERS